MSNPYLSKLTIIRVTPVNTGNVKAFVSVQLGNTLILHSVKVVQQPGQKAYVRLPDQKSGEKWFPVVESIDPLFAEAIQEKVLAAWQDNVVVLGQTREPKVRERW